MINPAITKIEYFIPNNDFSASKVLLKNNKDLSMIEKIIKKTGIDQKFKSEKNQYASDLAILAINNLVKKHSFDLNKVDFVIFCNQTPDYILPMSSSIIQNNIFKNKNDVGFVDISLGCSGYIYSLNIAHSLIKSGSYKKILLVTSDTYSKIIDEKDNTNLAIFGDGASVSVIEHKDSNDEKNIFEFITGCDGSGLKDLYFPQSGLKHFENKDANKGLIMNGTNVFSFTIKEVPNNIKDCLKKNNLTDLDINYYILHQANKFILETLRDKLQISKDKFLIDLRFGNTTSSTIPIAIYNLIKDKKVSALDKLLLCGFGVGLSWGSTIIKLNDDLINSIKRVN